MNSATAEANRPPRPPRDLAGLATEMLRCVSNTQHHQGMLRYWLMWRLPHILENIRTASGIKLHYCSGSPDALAADFPQLMLLSDVLVVGQCGNVLLPEWLCLERPMDQPWPSIDGVKDAMSVMFGKEDRPVPDDMLPFLFGDFSAFAPLGRVAYLPLATLLSAAHPYQPPPEAASEHLKSAVARAREDGLPTGVRLEELQGRAKKLFEDGKTESVNLLDLMKPEEKEQLPRNESGVRYYSGRQVYPGVPIDQPDLRWSPSDTLAWELELSRLFDTTLLVGGSWTTLVPPPHCELRINLPVARTTRPRDLAQVIADDPVAFQDFRKALRTAFAEAMAASGAEDFTRQIKRIQTEVIDDSVNRLRHQWKTLKRLRATRLIECGMGTVVIAAGMYFAGSLAQIGTLFGGAGLTFWREVRQHIQDQEKLRGEPMFFIWRLLPRRMK